MNDNNHYFEQIHVDGEMSEDSLIRRKEECEMVVSHLSKDPVWGIVLRNMTDLESKLNESWQEIIDDEKKLRASALLKMVCSYVKDIPVQYARELDNINLELQKIQNPDEFIQKDNDNG